MCKNLKKSFCQDSFRLSSFFHFCPVTTLANFCWFFTNFFIGPGKRYPIFLLPYNIQEKAVDFLEGMWAFAWQKDDILVLCRDSFGVKPLMYRHTDGGLIFSSSPHALENSNNRLNLFAFGMFRDFGYVPGPMTFQGVFDCCGT